LVFCFLISGFGIWVYLRKKDRLPLYLGIAYALFTVERLVALLGTAPGLDILGIVLRVLAYLIVLFALYRALVRK
jgi:hypothetical protein